MGGSSFVQFASFTYFSRPELGAVEGGRKIRVLKFELILVQNAYDAAAQELCIGAVILLRSCELSPPLTMSLLPFFNF